jgi:hypothetical protein
MPGAAITQHLTAGTEDVFNEVTQIFRHDFVLYAGMLYSWMTLFETEIPDTQPIFAHMTRQLQQATQQFFDDSQPRLYPQYLAPHTPAQQHICDWWDRFYTDFRDYIRPRLIRLGAYLRAYIHRPEFASVLQISLGPAANNERIDKLLLSAYNKLLLLFDAQHFDQRVAEALRARQIAPTG